MKSYSQLQHEIHELTHKLIQDYNDEVRTHRKQTDKKTMFAYVMVGQSRADPNPPLLP